MASVTDLEPDRRCAALVELADGRHACKAALYTDRDGHVRAVAAEVLGRSGDPGVAVWLIAAAEDDDLPSVREAAYRSLARLGAEAALPILRTAALEEPIWWARRAAVRALAAIAGAGAVPVLCAVLEDPFWRVRHAAVQALGVLGEHEPALRAEIEKLTHCNAITEGAFALLRAGWSGLAAVGDPVPAAHNIVRDGGGLANPDPAVVTARIEAAPPGTIDPLQLIPFLGDPHEALRHAAADELARRAGEPAVAAALEAAWHWLDDPRLPHAARSVTRLLDRLGDPAHALASRALAQRRSPGAVEWALGWVAATGSSELYAQVAACVEDRDVRLRRAAVRALARMRAAPELSRALADEDRQVRTIAVLGLRGAALDGVEIGEARPDEGRSPLIDPVRYGNAARRALVARAAQRGDQTALTHEAGDPDPIARALAIAALPAGEPLVRAARASEDPWLRAAALDETSAAEALAADPDLGVRRAAATLLIRRRVRSLPLAELAAASDDPWLRAQAARLVRADPAGLRLLLALSRDPDLAVRAAAADPLAACDQLDERLRVLLATELHPTLRGAAYAWLLRTGDEVLLRAALADPTEPAAVRAELAALAIVLAPDLAPSLPAPAVAPPHPPRATRRAERPPIARRPLGKTGISVAPLAISGAHELPLHAYGRACETGVNLFFWEPRYQGLTRFLRRARRRRDLVIAAGTYHASPAAITRDVETALRRLRTDTIDIFLLFWTRSPERLSAEARGCLADLAQAGKIRAAGLSTHHRDIAARAAESGAWDVIMTRHNAAHTGAETEVFPIAAAHDVGISSFSALCYGRMLAGAEGFQAADCYRYSLSRPGVTACIAAPRWEHELDDDLAALTAPALDEDKIAKLRAHGARVHAENRRFNTLLRRPGEARGSVRAQALAWLDEDNEKDKDQEASS